MIEFSEEQIIDAQNEAYLKSGHNAYFGNGFYAGVKFVLDALKNTESSSRIIHRREVLEAYEEYKLRKALDPNEQLSNIEDFLASNSC